MRKKSDQLAETNEHAGGQLQTGPSVTEKEGHHSPKSLVKRSKDRLLHIMVTIMIIGALIISGAGIFYDKEFRPHELSNLYGDAFQTYGKGIYQNDSAYRAPLFRATDLVMFFLVCPLLGYALVRDKKRKTTAARMTLVSIVFYLLYYSTILAFGVQYNGFHLLYLALFSFSFFGSLIGIASIDLRALPGSRNWLLPFKAIYLFLILCGMALMTAWMPDIINGWLEGRALDRIEHYTTEVSFLLDMGIIAPLCFICAYLLKQKNGFGYLLLDSLLMGTIITGLVLPAQTIWQLQEGIQLPMRTLVTRTVIFCVLALFAIYFKYRLLYIGKTRDETRAPD